MEVFWYVLWNMSYVAWWQGGKYLVPCKAKKQLNCSFFSKNQGRLHLVRAGMFYIGILSVISTLYELKQLLINSWLFDHETKMIFCYLISVINLKKVIQSRFGFD